MIGLQSRPHLLKPVPTWIGDVDLAQLLEQLPSSHLSTAVRPAEIGEALGVRYSHEGTHSLEPATSKLGPLVTANGAGDVKDGQPMTNHHDCQILGKQPLFACQNGYYVAAVAVHTENHAVEGLLANVHFGHGEDAHGHALHGLVRNRGPLGLVLDVPVIGIAGLADRATLPDLLNGGVENDMVDLEPTLHVKGLLLDPWVQHVVVPSFTKLEHPGLRY